MNWAMNAPDTLQAEARRYANELLRPVGGKAPVSASLTDALETMRQSRAQKIIS